MKTRLKHSTALFRQAVLAFFKFDVALRRHDGRYRLVFSSSGPGATEARSPRARQAAMQAERDLSLARTALTKLLDGSRGLRSSSKYLAAMEESLASEGWQGLNTVKRRVLEAALSEFEDLITNWSDEGLAGLRSRMAVTLAQRSREASESEDELEGAAPGMDADTPRATAARAIQAAMAPGDEDDAALLAAYEALGVAATERQVT